MSQIGLPPTTPPDANQLPTEDEAFGKGLPTADDAFGPDPSVKPSYTGSFADQYFSQGATNQRMEMFGQSVKDGWGSLSTKLPDEAEKDLQKIGVFNDYNKGQYNILKGFNEAFIRGSVAAVALPLKAIAASVGGVESIASQTGAAFGLPGLGRATAGAIDWAVQTGAPELHGFGHLPEARANAAIGEDEGNFFGTKSPTEAQAQARAEAVGAIQQQGLEPDIHNVARQIAPETFAHYDGLLAQEDALKGRLVELQKGLESHPDALAAQSKIEGILDRGNGNEEDLSESAQEELSKARDEKDEVLQRTTPEIQDVRDDLQKLNQVIVNLSPDVRYAYREAQRALNGSQNATTAPTEPVQAVGGETGTPVAPGLEGTQRPSQELSGGVGSSSLTGEIASDASKRLVEAGRPLEEADAVGQLIEAHYNSRAERFNGALGTGKELYDKEFPEIIRGGKAAKGRTLNQEPQIPAHANDEYLRQTLKSAKDRYTAVLNTQSYMKDYPFTVARAKDIVDRIDDLLSTSALRGDDMTGLNKLVSNYNESIRKIHENIASEKAASGELSSKVVKLFQGQRGSITLREGRNLIRLFKDADASTFLHETGHQWLEEMTKDAQHPDAPSGLKDDLQAVRDFLKNKGDPFTRGEHEKFARTFERYLREGTAPSKGLARVFEKFKQWLTQIYQKISQLKAPINDDIRGVFDRLITTPLSRDVIAPERLSDAQASMKQLADSERGIYKPLSDYKNATPDVSSTTSPAPAVAPSEAPQQAPSVATESPSRTGTPQSEATPAPQSGTPETGTTPGTPSSGQAEGETSTPSKPPSVEKPSDEPSSETLLKPDPVGNIKVENLTSEGDLQRFIKEFYDEHKEDIDRRRGKISDNDLLDLAEAAGLKASDINVEKLQEMSLNDGIPYSARVLGLRQAFIDSAEQTFDVSKKWPPDVAAYVAARQRHLWLQQVLTQVTAEAGRTLRVFQNLGKTSSVEEASALADLFQSQLGRTEEQLRTEMNLVSNLKDRSQVSGFIQDASKPSVGEMLLEFYRNNLISGPITHMTYAAGNKIFALYKAFPERLATAAVGSVREALTGKTGTERAYAGEAGEGLYAMLFGQKDGLKAAWDSFKAGQTLPLPGEDLASTPFTRSKAIPGIVGTAVRLPGERMVAPIHSFDRTVGYLTNRAQLIFRQAKSEGLDGTALDQRIAELEKNTPESIVKAARDEATSQSLMGRPGEPTRRFLAFIRTEFDLPVLGRTQPGSFVAPFISVVSNINRQAFLERGPLGLLSKTFWQNATGKNGTLAQDMSIAKMGLGIAVAGTAAGLLLQGKTTPAASSNYHQATIDEMAQGIPHGITIGNMSYQFNRLGIPGVMLAMATDVAYAGKIGLESHDYEKGVSLLLHSLGETFTQEGMMSGISDLLNAVDDPDRYGQSYVKNLLGSFVPYSVGLAQVAHLTDPYARDARTWLDSIQNKIPGMTEGLEPKVDVFGQLVPNKEYYGVYAEQVSNDPVVKAFKANGYFPAPVERKINGVSLSEEQYFQYAQKAGQVSKFLAHNAVNTPNFYQLSPQTRHDMLQSAMTQGRSSARAWMLAQYKDLAMKSIKLKYDLAHGAKE